MDAKVFKVVSFLALLSVASAIGPMMDSQFAAAITQFKTELKTMKTTGTVNGPKLINGIQAIIAAGRVSQNKMPLKAEGHLNDLINKINQMTSNGSATPDSILNVVQETKNLVKQAYRDEKGRKLFQM